MLHSAILTVSGSPGRRASWLHLELDTILNDSLWEPQSFLPLDLTRLPILKEFLFNPSEVRLNRRSHPFPRFLVNYLYCLNYPVVAKDPTAVFTNVNVTAQLLMVFSGGETSRICDEATMRSC